MRKVSWEKVMWCALFKQHCFLKTYNTCTTASHWNNHINFHRKKKKSIDKTVKALQTSVCKYTFFLSFFFFLLHLVHVSYAHLLNPPLTVTLRENWALCSESVNYMVRCHFIRSFTKYLLFSYDYKSTITPLTFKNK